MNSNSCKNEILADARMKSANADEIFGFASDEIKSTHSPSRRISPNEVGFHRSRRFHPPARVDLVEKSTDKVDAFFWQGQKARTTSWPSCGSQSFFAPWSGAETLTATPSSPRFIRHRRRFGDDARHAPRASGSVIFYSNKKEHHTSDVPFVCGLQKRYFCRFCV